MRDLNPLFTAIAVVVAVVFGGGLLGLGALRWRKKKTG